MKKSFCVAVLVTTILSGCASISIADKSAEIESKRFEPKPNLANVYIYRNVKLFQGGLASFHVNVDRTELADLNNKKYIKISLPPGKHVFKPNWTGNLDDDIESKLDLLAGNIYFLKAEIQNIHFMKQAALFVIQNANVAKEEISELSPIAISDNVSKALEHQNGETKPLYTVERKTNQPPTERVVLMPLRLADESLRGSMETALVQGLQQNYIVYSGDRVSLKAKEIFSAESKKQECDETLCLQKIAGAFQSELVSTANIVKQDGGYFLSIIIQNVFDNKVIFTNSIPCQNCNSFQVVEKLKELSLRNN